METRPVILYEDNHILVVRKPAGMLTQADHSGDIDLLTWLKQDIAERYQKPGQVFLGLVHRLDRPVGGLLVVARTSKAASRLSAQVRERRIIKEYLTVVQGCVQPPSGEWHDYLVKDRSQNQVTVADAGEGKEAWLAYRRLAWRPDLDQSLLAIRLGSGRGHQIRVQLASRGYPICGDRRYQTEAVDAAREGPWIALHAAHLAFEHPVRRTWCSFSDAPPQEKPWSDYPLTDSDLASIFSDETVQPW